MATKKFSLLEYLSSEGAIHIGDIGGTLLLWGLIYIVLLTLLSFAFSIPTGGQLEYHDFTLINNSLLVWSRDYLLSQIYAPIFHPAVFSLLVFYEYFRSHIGEKRLVDPSSILTNLRFGAPTALFYSAVFYFAWNRWCPKAIRFKEEYGEASIVKC